MLFEGENILQLSFDGFRLSFCFTLLKSIPETGTTDSSLRISQSFEGLGLGLPSTLTSESLADKATNEDSPLLDVVHSQANVSGNIECANPRLPFQLASELISPDDHSGSSDIMLLDSIDSDRVERTTSAKDAVVTALLEALSSFEQQGECYDLLPSRSFMQLHRFRSDLCTTFLRQTHLQPHLH